MENSNQNQKGIEFLKGKIRSRLSEVADQMGKYRYKLYLAMVDDCNDFEELKEMAELDLQMDMFDYVKTEINPRLEDINMSLADVRRLDITPSNGPTNPNNYEIDPTEIAEALGDVDTDSVMAMMLVNRLNNEPEEEKHRQEILDFYFEVEPDPNSVNEISDEDMLAEINGGEDDPDNPGDPFGLYDTESDEDDMFGDLSDLVEAEKINLTNAEDPDDMFDDLSDLVEAEKINLSNSLDPEDESDTDDDEFGDLSELEEACRAELGVMTEDEIFSGEDSEHPEVADADKMSEEEIFADMDLSELAEQYSIEDIPSDDPNDLFDINLSELGLDGNDTSEEDEEEEEDTGNPEDLFDIDLSELGLDGNDTSEDEEDEEDEEEDTGNPEDLFDIDLSELGLDGEAVPDDEEDEEEDEEDTGNPDDLFDIDLSELGLDGKGTPEDEEDEEDDEDTGNLEDLFDINEEELLGGPASGERPKPTLNKDHDSLCGMDDDEAGLLDDSSDFFKNNASKDGAVALSDKSSVLHTPKKPTRESGITRETVFRDGTTRGDSSQKMFNVFNCIRGGVSTASEKLKNKTVKMVNNPIFKYDPDEEDTPIDF